jgi:hypothetical protein
MSENEGGPNNGMDGYNIFILEERLDSGIDLSFCGFKFGQLHE